MAAAGPKINDTCAWTPNKVFIHFLLVSVETARVLLQSWWARLSTGASREAPVDNECLGKCKQVYASVGKSARQVDASLGKSAATECVLFLILARVLSAF